MKSKIKYILIAFTALCALSLYTGQSTVIAQEPKNEHYEKKKEERKKAAKEAEKEIKQRHEDIQSKQTKKMMKQTKKKSKRLKKGKNPVPWYKRIFRKS